MRETLRVLGLSSAFLLLSACGGASGDDDDDANDDTESGGTVTEEWREFCVATFTEDYTVVDPFDDPVFTAHKGEEYLLTGFGFSPGTRELAYLAPAGPYEFEVAAADGASDFPFTTPCTEQGAVPYYAAFTDVTVYAEEGLVTKLCDLAEGTALPRDVTVSAGYGLTNFDLTGPAIYEVQLNVFSAQCGGQASGFVNVPSTRLFGFTTFLVPIIEVMAPD